MMVACGHIPILSTRVVCVRLKEHPWKTADPSLFCRQRTASRRKRLAVSSFRRRRRLRRWRPSPISRSPLRPNQRLPEPSRPTHPNSATPGRLRPSATSTGGAATTENGREAAERDRKSAAASGGSPQAPAGTLHTQIWARPTHPRPCWSCAAGPARLRPTGTQSDACGRAGGRWVGGRLGSRSHGQPGRVCRRPAVARGRGQAQAGERAAVGRRAARRAPAAACALNILYDESIGATLCAPDGSGTGHQFIHFEAVTSVRVEQHVQRPRFLDRGLEL